MELQQTFGWRRREGLRTDYTLKAIVAVAASMLRAIYYMLRDGTPYKDLGAGHFTTVDRQRTTAKLIKRLADLGVQVEIKAAA